MADFITTLLTGVETILGESEITLNQIEPYEGQLEDLDNFVIVPPALFTEVELGSNKNENYLNIDSRLHFYLVTSHMKGTAASSMYALLIKIIAEFHNVDVGAERLFFDGFERLAIIPGFCAYRATFRFEHLE